MNRSLLFLPVVLLILAACANERAITGGPEDTEAPTIVSASIEQGALGVDPQPVIRLKFSEQMQRSTVEAAVKLWPRPSGEMKIKTGWTWLEVSFSEPLDTAETYLMTLDKQASDLRKNGLERSYVLAFSPGSRLNQGKLIGRVVGGRDVRENGTLFLYRDFQRNLDSLRSERATYEFQPDDSGGFALDYLAERTFMLFYHWDRNRNGRIDGEDYFGRPTTTTVYPQLGTPREAVMIWPQRIPPERLKLLKARVQSPELLLIRTNQVPDDRTLRELRIHFPGLDLPPRGVTWAADDELGLLVDMTPIPADSTPVWISGFVDTAGVVLASDTLALTRRSEPDTLTLAMEVHDFQPASGKDPGLVSFLFNQPLLAAPDSGFRFYYAGDTLDLAGQITARSSMLYEWQPDSVLLSDRSLKWELRTDLLVSRLARLPEDSLLSGTLTGLPADSLGGLFLSQNLTDLAVLILNGPEGERIVLAEAGKMLHLDDLPAGQYSLIAYADLNGNGRYDPGGRQPGRTAEPFWVYPESIRIRARWDLELDVWE